MAIYGSYETVRELSNDLVSAVHSARHAGGSGEAEFAVKVIFKKSGTSTGDFFAEVSESQNADEAARIFEASVRWQQQVAQSDPNVAPVLDSGSDDAGAWYVSHFYPRTVQKLIQGRVALNEAAILHIMRSVVRGVAAHRKITGHGHGNLKPSNILVGGEPKITDAEVRISDPSGQPETEPGAHEKADLKALGTLLYQLVFRKEISGGGDWLILPLEKSREWTQLFGKRADRWLDWCNRLLDPNLDLESTSVENVLTALERLESKPPVSLGTVALVAILTLMGVGGVIFGTKMMKAKRSNVMITVDPRNVQVEIDGQDYGRISEKGLALKLDPGSHTVVGRYQAGEADHLRLVSYTNVVEVTEDSEEILNIPIYLEYGSLQIESQPEGTAILLARDDSGVSASLTNRYYDTGLTTPSTIPIMRPGTWQVLLRKEGFVRTNVTVTVEANREQASLVASLTKEIPGSLEVIFSSAPFPADVKMTKPDGSTVAFNTKSDPFQSLLPGNYQFEASAKNFAVLRTNIALSARSDGSPPTVAFQFPNAEVALRSRPPGAKVWVGDADVSSNAEVEGQTVTDLKIYWPPGDTTFRFELPGHYTNVIRTNLVASADLRLTARLTPMMGLLDVTCAPPGDGIEFLVYSNGQTIRRWTTNLTDNSVVKIQEAPGTYVVEARYPGLGTKTLTNLMELGQTKQWPLRFDHGTVQFQVHPLGVGQTDISLDNEALGDRASRLLIKAPGEYAYVARNSLLGEITGSITVTDNRLTQAPIRFPYGFLTITSFPPKAVVYDLQPDGTKGAPLGETFLTVTSKLGAVQYLLELGTNKPYTLRTRLVAGLNPSRGRDFTKFVPDSYFNGIGMELIWVEEPLGFRVGKYEVTQGEFEKVMGYNPSKFSGDPNMPVENISWEDAEAFCVKLTALETAGGTMPEPGLVYRLPTDAEWKQMVGGAKVEDSVFKSSQPQKVGSTERPNDLGLFDIFGNVREITIATGFQGVETQGGSYSSSSNVEFLGTRFGVESKGQNLGGTGFRVVLAPR